VLNKLFWAKSPIENVTFAKNVSNSKAEIIEELARYQNINSKSHHNDLINKFKINPRKTMNPSIKIAVDKFNEPMLATWRQVQSQIKNRELSYSVSLMDAINDILEWINLLETQTTKVEKQNTHDMIESLEAKLAEEYIKWILIDKDDEFEDDIDLPQDRLEELSGLRGQTHNDNEMILKLNKEWMLKESNLFRAIYRLKSNKQLKWKMIDKIIENKKIIYPLVGNRHGKKLSDNFVSHVKTESAIMQEAFTQLWYTVIDSMKLYRDYIKRNIDMLDKMK